MPTAHGGTDVMYGEASAPPAYNQQHREEIEADVAHSERVLDELHEASAGIAR